MKSDFERAHAFTSVWEGGFIDHPSDPGGATAFGVTQSVWTAWCKARGLPVKPLRSVTPADTLPLYQERYWRPLAAALPWPLSAVIYDMSVNHGLGDTVPDSSEDRGATWMLYRARQLRPTGSPLEQALAACDAREQFYHAIVRGRPASGVFLKGWLRRVNAQREWLRANATPSAAPAPATPPVFLTDAAGKRAAWDGKPARYAGAPISAEWLASLRLLCPPGTALGVVVAADGALILSRITPP